MPIDLLLVLGSHDPASRARRCATAFNAWHREGSRIPIVLSGRKYGPTAPDGTPEAIDMSGTLLHDYKVPMEHLRIEKESLDTFGNIVLSAPVIAEALEDLTLVGDRPAIGVVADGHHLPRTMRIATHILGGEYRFVAIPTPYEGTAKERFLERVRDRLLGSELARLRSGVAPANAYLAERHPYYNADARPIGPYGFALKVSRVIREGPNGF